MAEKRVSPIVKKSNTLCRASWYPSKWEARLVALVASKIHTEDKDFKRYEIPIADILQDTKGGKSYKLIDKATDYAMSRVVKLKKNNSEGYKKYNLFFECDYTPEKGILTVKLHPKLKPHFLDLKQNFAKYDLTQFLLLPSTYSQRIFEILRSWDNEPEVTIDLDELHIMLNVPPSLKSDYKNFKRLVLVKSYNDIHKHTDLKYEWEPVKKGRKIVAIRFIFAAKRAQKAVAKQKTEKQKRKSEHNNKYGKIALICIEKHRKNGGICKSDQSSAACKLCRDNFPCVINQGL